MGSVAAHVVPRAPHVAVPDAGALGQSLLHVCVQARQLLSGPGVLGFNPAHRVSNQFCHARQFQFRFDVCTVDLDGFGAKVELFGHLFGFRTPWPMS